MIQKINTEKAIICKLTNTIVLLEFKPDDIFELEDAIEVNSLIFELIKGQPFLSLIDISHRYGSISKEAREYFAHDPKTKEIRLAEAFIITNLPMRILANFYKNFHQPKNPIKFFKTKKEAIKWLNEVYSETTPTNKEKTI